MKSIRQTAVFKAKADNGEEFTVIESQEFDSVLSGTGTITEIEGIKKWKTSAGDIVRQIDTQTYRLATSQQVIKKI
ncbi:MAG TPA: hypothetical protein VEH58_04090 [Dehalococcoidales bacterium]|nr:hypothetical protein [Dehalococcoidales bacterium]